MPSILPQYPNVRGTYLHVFQELTCIFRISIFVPVASSTSKTTPSMFPHTRMYGGAIYMHCNNLNLLTYILRIYLYSRYFEICTSHQHCVQNNAKYSPIQLEAGNGTIVKLVSSQKSHVTSPFRRQQYIKNKAKHQPIPESHTRIRVDVFHFQSWLVAEMTTGLPHF